MNEPDHKIEDPQDSAEDEQVEPRGDVPIAVNLAISTNSADGGS